MLKDIFELEIINFDLDMDDLNPYPAFEISSSSRYLFHTFEDARSQIKELAEKNGQKKIYRFILRQLPLNERLYDMEFIKLYVYDGKGNFLAQSLCSNCDQSGWQNEFKGRPEDLIHFRKGEIVEWFDSREGHLGIITDLPLNPHQCLEITERYNKCHEKFNRDWLLDWSDDSYTIIDSSDYMASHEHVFSPFVSKPTFKVPVELRSYLENAWQKVKDEK